MISAITQFKQSLEKVKEMHTLYCHLKDNLQLPNDLTDLLRSEIVNLVSALDKLVHELVRIGMIDIFFNRRTETAAYNNFTISLETLKNVNSSSPIQPPEYFLEQEIVNKHKHLSFQYPDKISEALSLIWGESHKLQKIAIRMNMDQRDLKTQLKNIVSKRNQIVHESDIDIITGDKIPITKSDVELIYNFIESFGQAIYDEIM